jgi:hypothetical protein
MGFPKALAAPASAQTPFLFEDSSDGISRMSAVAFSISFLRPSDHFSPGLTLSSMNTEAPRLTNVSRN